MTLGVKDLKNVALPTAWDGNELSRIRLKDGTTYEQVVRDIEDALGIFNSSLNSGYLGRILSVTTEEGVEYRSGGTNGFDDETEQTQADRQHAENSGHMLPLLFKDRGMGWTKRFLEEARRSLIDNDISSLVEDAADIYEKTVLTRFFSMSEESGKSKGLGATGISVPFADGGAGTIDYIPTPRKDRMINTFDATHDHYLRLNGITQANLETAVGHLWEHGIDGPYELLVPQVDLGSWQNTTNVTGFKQKADPLVQYGTANDLANIEAEMYEGVVTTKYGPCRLKANGRIPTNYWGVTKSYGQGDQRNPLRVRYDPTYGFGVKLIVEAVTLFPFTGAIGQFRFGAGVGPSRVSAVLVENDDDGDYASPTIS